PSSEIVQSVASAGSTSSVPSLKRTRPSKMLVVMRKSLAAVETCGSSDCGSAIWPTTSTLGGVWATAGAAASSTAVAIPASSLFMVSSPLKFRSGSVARASFREIIYQYKWTWQHIYPYKLGQETSHDLFHSRARPHHGRLRRRHGDGRSGGGFAGAACPRRGRGAGDAGLHQPALRP